MMFTDHRRRAETQTLKFNLNEIKTKPLDMCIGIPIVNSEPIGSPFHWEFLELDHQFQELCICCLSSYGM